MNNACRSAESLHYLDSWNRHCGGNWSEFASRTITITDSIILAYAGVQMSRVSRMFGKAFGIGLVSKSANDIYEAWSGERGLIRNSVGDDAYLAIDLAILSYGFFRKVPRMNYLGNPMRDFYVKDPRSYEYAYKQYSNIEVLHLTFSSVLKVYNDNNKSVASRLSIEDAWQAHLERLSSNDE